jgi:hypothetical protein
MVKLFIIIEIIFFNIILIIIGNYFMILIYLSKEGKVAKAASFFSFYACAGHICFLKQKSDEVLFYLIL